MVSILTDIILSFNHTYRPNLFHLFWQFSNDKRLHFHTTWLLSNSVIANQWNNYLLIVNNVKTYFHSNGLSFTGKLVKAYWRFSIREIDRISGSANDLFETKTQISQNRRTGKCNKTQGIPLGITKLVLTTGMIESSH